MNVLDSFSSIPHQQRQPHILIIEDDAFVRAGLQGYLQAEGFSTAVATSPDEAERQLQQRVCDLVLLDLYLTGGTIRTGLDLGLRIKRQFTIPIIVITIEDSYETQISAVNEMAEYYFVKPLDTGKLGLLKSCITRALGHYGGNPSLDYSQRLLSPTTRVNLQRHWVERWEDGKWQREKLSPTETVLFLFLLRNQGQTLTYETLAAHLKLEGSATKQNTAIRMHITNIRKKLGDPADHPRIILSVRGVGYQLVITSPPAEEGLHDQS